MKRLFPSPLLLSLVFLFSWGGAPAANARGNHDQLAASAIECAGIFFIMTATDDAYTSTMMTGLTEMMGFVFSAHATHDSHRSLSNGDVSRNRDQAVDELMTLYDSKPEKLVDIYKRCFAWRNAIGEHMEGQPPSDREELIKPMLLAAPGPPSAPMISREERQKAEHFIGRAFKNWTEAGRRLPSDIQEQLRREIEKNLEKNPPRR